MKKIMAGMLIVLLCLTLAACGKTAGGSSSDNSGTASETVESSVASAESVEEDALPKAPEDVLKCVYQDDSQNQVTIWMDNEDETSYGMIVSIFRLTEIEGTAVLDGDDFVFDGLDPNGNPIQMRFAESDSYTLEVTESTWEYLPTGETFPGFMPDIVEGNSDLTDCSAQVD